MEKKVLQVVAALITEGNRVLICQRPADKSCGLLWEFAGGKVEPGETKRQALIRECREELDITVAPGAVFWETTYAYPDRTVCLTLYHTAITGGTPRLLEHADLRWVERQALKAYAFCPADMEIIRMLAEEPCCAKK